MGDDPPAQPKKSRGAGSERRSTATQDNDPGSGQGASDAGPHGTQSSRPSQSGQPTLRPAPGVEYYSAPHGYHSPRPTPLNMGDMSSALPGYQTPSAGYSQQGVHQSFMPAHQPPGVVYPIQQVAYAGQTGTAGPAYNVPYSPPYANPYAQQPHPHPQMHPGGPGYQPYLQNSPQNPGPPVVGQTSMYGQSYYPQQPYPTPYGSSQTMPGYPMREQQGAEYYSAQGRRSSGPSPPKREGERRGSAVVYDVSQTIVDGSSPMKSTKRQGQATGGAQQLPIATSQSTPRGPPRKPKQSGHALWVGNLPPGANVVDLKDHFSRDATEDIESVFLISKSNCAFVNYKSEAACSAAMLRFHDSRFHGVRLVCRLRRGLTIPGSSPNPSTSSARVEDGSKSPLSEEEQGSGTDAKQTGVSTLENQAPLTRVPERFFIVKSLTVEDLELSRRSGIWATQTHNEASLNRAYETADNVYLIFSANKSGEYFGYARMTSPISDDDASGLEMPQRPENPVTDTEILNVTPTLATATAPKGRIIDDSARGTIFWEADSSEDDGGDETKSEKSVDDGADENTGPGSQSFGKPFRIEWVSTERLPFYRTRGLRNPWNANREVKIARDGTEIEPGVGRRLTQLFHVNAVGQATTGGGGQTPQGLSPRPL